MKILKTNSYVFPDHIDNNSSSTTTYVNYNISELTEKDEDGEERTLFEYSVLKFSKQEYSIYQTVKDWTAEQKQSRINELQAYLSETDWYAARLAETGVKIPKDIKQARADARVEISLLRDLEKITNE